MKDNILREPTPKELIRKEVSDFYINILGYCVEPEDEYTVELATNQLEALLDKEKEQSYDDGYQMGVRDEQECIFNCPEEHEPLLEWLDKEIQKAQINELVYIESAIYNSRPPDINNSEWQYILKCIKDRIKQLEKGEK